MPRLQPENMEHNKSLYERVNDIASRKGCTPSQLALAWVHHQGNGVCPIPGTTKIENLKENIEALSVKLSAEEMSELESIASVGVKGDRYGPGVSTWRTSDTPPLSTWKGLMEILKKYKLQELETQKWHIKDFREVEAGGRAEKTVRTTEEAVESCSDWRWMGGATGGVGGVAFVDGKCEICGDPAYVRTACEGSLKRLGVDCIDLYYQHGIDTRLPIEVTIGELKKLVEEGKIKYIGLSEASASTIRRAHAVHPVTAIQLEWSLWSRDVEEEIIPTCRELGIGIVAYSPLGRGFFSSGPKLMENLTEGDFRKVHNNAKKETEYDKKYLGQFVSLPAVAKAKPSSLIVEHENFIL
ncbi:hypothetical protein ACH5RR_031946 [Cinchona calisaya]|uniref:NADP-dependent oxidoreductase domain-containing protein n=1 Tax=Cinchona calisaya TaxID=153742 RepID=A0ABD2YGP0_9GENT